MERIITLGRACRPAYQARTFSSKYNMQISSNPLDWTVTPYIAIARLLGDDFDPKKVLAPLTSYISPDSKSVTCGYSGINFHHALSPKIVKAHLKNSSAQNQSLIPASLLSSPEWDNAKSRFQHTYTNFLDAIAQPGTLFLRWRRKRHAGDQYSLGEDPSRLNELLCSSNKVNQGFKCLVVETHEISSHDAIANPVEIQSLDGGLLCCVLKERKGYNGDQTNNWRGDESAWEPCFRLARNSLFN